MSGIYNILNQLKNTSSRNGKEEILRSLSGETLRVFKMVAVMALSPGHDFYVRKYPRKGYHKGTLSLEDALMQLEQLTSRKLTGNAAIAFLEKLDSELSVGDADVLHRVIQRDLRCGVSSATLNKIWPNLIYVHPYMRCSDFTKKNMKNIKFPCFSQTKEDGHYTDIIVRHDGSISYMSRSGSILANYHGGPYEEIFRRCPGYVFQGEAVVLEENGTGIMDRSKGNGYLNSNSVDPNRIVFILWDMIPVESWKEGKCSTEYAFRLKNLAGFINDHCDKGSNICLIETKVVSSVDAIMEHFKENLEKGLEGTVIKNFHGAWEPGTSKDQVKCKVEFTCDLRVVAIKEGTGKNKGLMGALLCESEDGLVQVSVGGGYSDKQRKEYNHEGILNQIIEVKANDILVTDNGISLYLPRHVKLRKDKTEADSYDRIKEQMAAFADTLQAIK